ncbi:hypothetical protein O181_031413 [Austropuccinia psidii MF-1]|uniref:Uncharacterized protein n=1 Tax=Austropuccinia psidii MF-1 TaxID=1389203 RepID=A0A9Q3CZM5_9BASI|nr:hypothetical protein [Austropuccinia psidii MF-1]
MKLLIQLHCHYTGHIVVIYKPRVEKNYIPLETQSQASTPVTPSEPEGSKGKGKRHSESLITAKKWPPIATQRSRKPQTSASIKGKPTLTACTGKITIINPVVTSKGKLPKSADKKSVQGKVKDTLASKGTNQRTEKACPEPEDLEEDTLDTVVDGKTLGEIIHTLPFTFQLNRNLKPQDWKDMDQVLQLHQLLKDLFQWSMDSKRFNLASHWEELGESFQRICLKEIAFKGLMIITKGCNLTRQFRLLEVRANRIRENQATIQATEEQLTQKGPTQMPSGSQGEGQISSPEKTRIQGQKQDHFQPEEERVRANDPEAVGLGERSTQEPEVVVNNSRISSPPNRNITPAQIEHNVVTPESNLNSDALWLKMSQFAENTQKQLAELQASHERMKTLTASMDKIVKNLQEGHAQLSKASEETTKILNLVFEEQQQSKRDRDFLDQDIIKLFNVYHIMKPQPQGHAMDTPYHQDDIKPDAMLVNKATSPSQYQDEDNMSYSEKESLKHLPEASSWRKFCGNGEYDHMELIDYIDGLFIYVPSIPEYWITSRLNTAFKGHVSIWCTEMKEIHGRRNWPWWKSQIIQKYSNGTCI